ncbi:MAG TPA: acetyl-CoA carboxylase carboxyltransferase subunit beta [Vitreimonas sp.]|nr:acetyl-CoA carboxylase carboxyltransferase subunit beta [Vitreimonas sp.]
MNWLSNFSRPGLQKKKTDEPKPDTPDNLWVKDPISGDLIYRAELETSCWVTPSGFHMRIGPEPRFKQMFDDAAWQVIPVPKVLPDPLKFKDDKKYVDRLKSARAKVHREDCMAAGYGRIGGAHAVVLVQDFDVMGGSLGMAAGEAFVCAAEAAVRRKAALIMVTASGGARMQEGILSLMQMPRTTIAIQMLRDAGLPYIVVLADPTTGGVTASYAMLGDIHIAEPGALIGFAGPRVIEQTIRQKLPEGFQRAEYLLDKGMVDMVVDRRQLKATIATLLSVLMHKRAAVEGEGGEMFELNQLAPEANEEDAKPSKKRKAAKETRAKAAE